MSHKQSQHKYQLNRKYILYYAVWCHVIRFINIGLLSKLPVHTNLKNSVLINKSYLLTMHSIYTDFLLFSRGWYNTQQCSGDLELCEVTVWLDFFSPNNWNSPILYIEFYIHILYKRSWYGLDAHPDLNFDNFHTGTCFYFPTPNDVLVSIASLKM